MHHVRGGQVEEGVQAVVAGHLRIETKRPQEQRGRHSSREVAVS